MREISEICGQSDRLAPNRGAQPRGLTCRPARLNAMPTAWRVTPYSSAICWRVLPSWYCRYATAMHAVIRGDDLAGSCWSMGSSRIAEDHLSPCAQDAATFPGVAFSVVSAIEPAVLEGWRLPPVTVRKVDGARGIPSQVAIDHLRLGAHDSSHLPGSSPLLGGRAEYVRAEVVLGDRIDSRYRQGELRRNRPTTCDPLAHELRCSADSLGESCLAARRLYRLVDRRDAHGARVALLFYWRNSIATPTCERALLALLYG